MEKQESQSSPKQESLDNSLCYWVLFYSAGALIGLLCAFSPTLSPLQSTNCLVLSWLLAVGALAMSILAESRSDEEDLEQPFDEF